MYCPLHFAWGGITRENPDLSLYYYLRTLIYTLIYTLKIEHSHSDGA